MALCAVRHAGSGRICGKLRPRNPGRGWSLRADAGDDGILCTNALFWALPTAILSGSAAAAGIAWINSVGNLAGYVSPFLVGTIRDRTHSMSLALLALSAAALASTLISLYVTRRPTGHTT